MSQAAFQEPGFNPIAPQPERSGALPVLLIAAAGILLPLILAFGLTTSNELRVLGTVVGAFALVLVAARPFWGLLFFIALLYARPEETFPALQGMRATLIVSLATMVGCSLHLMLNRERLVRTPLGAMLIGFGITAVLSAIPLGTAGDVAQEVGKLVALVLLVLNLVRCPDRYRSLVTAILLFTAYLSLYSLYLYFTGQALKIHDIERSKSTGIFGDPNDLAATIAAGLALTLSRVVTTRGAARLWLLALCGLFVYAIVLTGSRGGALALMTVGGGFFFVYVKQKALAITLAVAAISLFMVAGPSRMRTFDSAEESANQRFWFWHAGLEEFKRSPLLGVGFGQFPSINGGATAHNSFVLCFTELGIIGYFFWIGCIYFCFRPLPRREEDGEEPPGTLKQDLLGARLALAAFLFAGFFLSRTYVPILYVFFSLPIAAQVAASKDLNPFRAITERRASDYAWVFGLCVFSIALVRFMVDRLR